MKITFLGATRTVTGSKYLLEQAGLKVLIDCGLYQGYKQLRLRNWAKFPINPEEIDAVILTHAHIDHSGYIPLFVKNGFKGKIYCSDATFDLCEILLPDSGYLHEEDARRANKYGYSKHKPALPLYTEEDARNSLSSFKIVKFNKKITLSPEFSFELQRSGHILGSSFITVMYDEQKIVFSGDLGRQHDPVMNPPVKLQEADYIVIESTYGDRLHANKSPEDEICKVIKDTAKAGGTLLIPSFAVGRTQSILYHIHNLKKKNLIPNLPVFLDSPMAIDATRLMVKHIGEHSLSKELTIDVCKTAKYINTIEESKQLNNIDIPCIIISASGMATGGRVLHHLKAVLPKHRNTVLFVGFQAGGTRGDRLIKHEKEVKIHGQMYPVKAKIVNINSMSAHADYKDTLEWLENFNKPPRKIFITHGEEDSALSLQKKIEEKLNWETCVPDYLYSEDI